MPVYERFSIFYKVIWDCFVFPLLRSVIGSENLRHYLNPWIGSKTKKNPFSDQERSFLSKDLISVSISGKTDEFFS